MDPKNLSSSVGKETEDYFAHRFHLCLVLGAIIFPLFTLLDAVRAQQWFFYFLRIRILSALYLLALIPVIRIPHLKKYLRHIMYSVLLLGTFGLSLMAVKLGGFASDYYLGILQLIVGYYSVMSLRLKEGLVLGFVSYLLYVAVVLHGCGVPNQLELGYLANNSFFFLALVLVFSVQSNNELQVHVSSFFSIKQLKTLRQQLNTNKENLEVLVEQKANELAESTLNFRDLYDNIPDLVVLLDMDGSVQMVNNCGTSMLNKDHDQLGGADFSQFVVAGDRGVFADDILSLLERGKKLDGKYLRLSGCSGQVLDTEISGNAIDMPDGKKEYQLVIRDISAIKQMENQVLVSSQLLDGSRQSAIFGLARLAEHRDDDTGAHLQRLREYTKILATELSLLSEYRSFINDSYIEDLCTSSLLHDIGKIGIPDSILLKPGPLTEAEFATMKKHCEYGYNALVSAENDSGGLPFLRMGQAITLYHHEQWCGLGYPRALAGKDIPLSVRIVSLVDVYDALTSERPYKKAFSHEKAQQIIFEDIGIRFDPAVGSVFLKNEKKFRQTCYQLGGGR